MQITVFTKPACQPCKATKRALDKLDIEYNTVELDADKTAEFTAAGLLSAPVVQVDVGDGASWTWAGHAPSQIEKLAELFNLKVAA